MAGEADTCVLIIVAIIFPPAAVAFVAGCGVDLCLNIFLTILGYLPGCIHAFWLILRRAEANERYGYKNWAYSGMGEYNPQAPPAKPPQYVQPQAPPGQQPAGYVPPPSQPPVEQKPGAPPAPAEQKAETVPPPAPADQKQADSTAAGNPPPSGT